MVRQSPEARLSAFAAQALRQTRVVIPTFNAERYVPSLVVGLQKQGIAPRQVLVVDSSSSDRTVALFREYGASIESIRQAEFNHGGTRRRAATMCPDTEFLIYLTQDAIPADAESFSSILRVFADATVGMAYGRQLPRQQAGAIERHARLNHYPDSPNVVRTLNDRTHLGIKTVFASDSFAAYRRSALFDVGNFPEDAFFAEDQIVAGRMLLKGWNVAYAGQSRVIHSHGYSVREEFQRYFDVGVFHARNSWLLEEFGGVNGEGLRHIRSELAYLLRHEPLSVPVAMAKTFAKYLGYRLGRLERIWSNRTKARLSMSGYYWRQ